MATVADVFADNRRAGSAGRAAAVAFAHLVGLAFVMSVAFGILLTAAAVALPAPLDECGASAARGAGRAWSSRSGRTSSPPAWRTWARARSERVSREARGSVGEQLAQGRQQSCLR